MDSEDIKYMRIAIEQAKNCIPEDGRIHPLVGAVVVKDGVELAKGYRGEQESGEHAEYTVLEKKLKDISIVGSVIYTTLEPCTTRKHPKVPCVERLIERKVKRVVIGMLDPDPRIRGLGQRMLRDANIATDFFSPELMAEIEEMNRDFTRSKRNIQRVIISDQDFIRQNKDRDLDIWYKKLNRIYWNRNFPRPTPEIFSHLVEVIGGLSSLASEKNKPGINTQTYISKAIAWWLGLCGKMGINSPEELIWNKFPGVCPYCKEPRCLGIPCKEQKKKSVGIDWNTLNQIGKTKKSQKPRRLSSWQLMFADIYQPYSSYAPAFGRLMEEIGELSEAVRVFPSAPGYFLSEAADVYAWLMHVQNILDDKNDVELEKRGSPLEESMCRIYPDSCLDCGQQLCTCPPILESTIGRIAHEVPPSKVSFGTEGLFMTAEQLSKFFS